MYTPPNGNIVQENRPADKTVFAFFAELQERGIIRDRKNRLDRPRQEGCIIKKTKNLFTSLLLPAVPSAYQREERIKTCAITRKEGDTAMMSRILIHLFDQQYKKRNRDLQQVIDAVHDRYFRRSLTMGELELVAGAGRPESTRNQNENGEKENRLP